MLLCWYVGMLLCHDSGVPVPVPVPTLVPTLVPVEGWELEALNGVDFARHRPKYIMIEVWENEKPKLMSKMAEVGYKLCPG